MHTASTRPTRLAWMFHLGHGHYTQFLNFQECAEQEVAERSVWLGLSGYSSGSRLSGLPLLPATIRWQLNQVWHARNGLAQLQRGDAVLFASEPQLYWLPMLQQFRPYWYTDLTPSLMAGLAPWYDALLKRNRRMFGVKLKIRRQVVKAFHRVITMSEWAANGVRRDYGVPADRVHAILPGANLKRWHLVDRSQRRGGPTRILLVGGQFELKGGPLLLDWAETTASRNWEIDIVTWPGELPAWIQERLGNPGMHDKVTASLAPRLPNVRVHCGLTANTPELMALYRDADVFCLPTRADGSSIASLEAMATGLPVIVGGVGGIPELFEHGHTGFLVRPGNAVDLGSALDALVADQGLRLRVGHAARAAFEDHLNTERQVREIAATIDLDGPATERSRFQPAHATA
jgi:glycosyltransferase involved in cell wall biosynthesis